jgi:hypothetical protein
VFDRVSQYGVDPSGRGAANMSALTVPRGAAVYHESPVSEVDEADPEAHPATSGNPLTFVFLILGIIVALYFVRKSSSLIQGETFGVNWFTFIETGTMAVGFILLTKAVFGRFNVPGISNAVAAI